MAGTEPLTTSDGDAAPSAKVTVQIAEEVLYGRGSLKEKFGDLEGLCMLQAILAAYQESSVGVTCWATADPGFGCA